MHTDSGMTGISLSGYMPYMTVASLEMSDEPFIFLSLLIKDADTHVAISIFLYIEAYFAFYLMKQVFDI